jgi:hypothetical protein
VGQNLCGGSRKNRGELDNNGGKLGTRIIKPLSIVPNQLMPGSRGKFISMRTLAFSPHLCDEQLATKRNKFRSKPAFSYWQILYLLQVDRMNRVDLLVPLVGLPKLGIYKVIKGCH